MNLYINHFLLPVLIAFLLDCIIGDPRSLPHPVRALGFINIQYEKLCRKFIKHEITSGFVAVTLVISTAFLVAWILLKTGSYFGIELVISSILIYYCIAARDLCDHALRILKPLKSNDIPAARGQLAMIVGRDTDSLDEGQICRATIESVAESTVDGITSPLFYALIFGPLGAVVYRAINTMDSMYAYKNEKYLYFGRTAAYVDDAANFLPARLTGLVMCLAALVCRADVKNCWRIMRRDGQKHPSPNSAISEAAMAGALNIQLGGPSTYKGVLSNKQTLGEPIDSLQQNHISQALRMMYVTCILFIVTSAALLSFF
ncbi:MAG: cobalamin biosynthesis protein CobD [Lentisphaeraceae bacterium]|nr:cobalamin biosynthesis protein CobD [Lentisphaeraceae bacterium]